MIVDLFAGPGGWSEALAMLGLFDVGYELDAAACATRAAASHVTIRADLATYTPPTPSFPVQGVIASPPCPDWSAAGTRLGRSGRTGSLVDVVPDWVDQLRPDWIACEQVPPALIVWQEHALIYRRLGYRVWTGILNAADYGVPQTRQRAFLLASRTGPVHPPEPTHCRGGAQTLLGTLHPWVSMADALGWIADRRPRADGRTLDTAHPSPTLCGHRNPAWAYPGNGHLNTDRDWKPGGTRDDAQTIAGTESPGHKINGDDQARLGTEEATARYGDRAGTDAIRLTVAQALTLQSFRPDYPVQGTKTKQFEQIGNAVPPLLAAHVLGAVTGAELEIAA